MPHHYNKDHGPPERWWMHAGDFPTHDVWANVSKQPHARIEIMLDLGPPRWAISQQSEGALTVNRSSIRPPERFLLDTGAHMSVLTGALAERFYGVREPNDPAQFVMADGTIVSAPTGWLSARICGRWRRLLFGFWIPAYLDAPRAKIGLFQKMFGRRKNPDNVVVKAQLDTDGILGMQGLLWPHMLSITHEQVDVFCRPARGEKWSPGTVWTQPIAFHRSH